MGKGAGRLGTGCGGGSQGGGAWVTATLPEGFRVGMTGGYGEGRRCWDSSRAPQLVGKGAPRKVCLASDAPGHFPTVGPQVPGLRQ